MPWKKAMLGVTEGTAGLLEDLCFLFFFFSPALERSMWSDVWDFIKIV